VVGPGLTSLSAGVDPVLGPGGCSGDGLFVVSNVTLKINGTITSTPGNSCSGIVVGDPMTRAATNVVVTLGTLVGFEIGVEAGDPFTPGTGKVNKSQFSRLRIFDPGDTGIGLQGDDNVIELNIIRDDIPGGGIAGIWIPEGSRNRVSRNQTYNTNTTGIVVGSVARGGVTRDNIVSQNIVRRSQGSSHGFEIGGDHAIVEKNQSTDNSAEGFKIAGTNHQVNNNVALRNADDGFVVDCDVIFTCTFLQNQSNHNGRSGAGFGIVDNALVTSSYDDNVCVGNPSGGSSPSNLDPPGCI
jgi:hypothetical protein